jgi:hypothetical protein
VKGDFLVEDFIDFCVVDFDSSYIEVETKIEGDVLTLVLDPLGYGLVELNVKGDIDPFAFEMFEDVEVL